MTTTAKDLIRKAYARRTANDPDKLATKSELIGVLSDYIREVYAAVCRAQEDAEKVPIYFASSATVAASSSKWARPATAISVFKITDADGDEVALVPFEDQESELAPRVYELGGFFFTVNETGDPDESADSLTFYYAIDHPALNTAAAWDHADNTLDASWKERHNNLLVVRLARYLAAKGGRGAEAETLGLEQDRNLAMLLAEAVGEDFALRARLASG